MEQDQKKNKRKIKDSGELTKSNEILDGGAKVFVKILK
jgi:hypothetical protein